VGAVAGFASVLFVGARTLESALVLAFVVAALIGAIVGGWLGYSVGRWLVLTPPDRRA
jgi:membrane protein DedA with SNARE-associated domain